MANLPERRWVRRILAWNPSVRYRSLGRRPHTWDYHIQAFCRYKGLGPWLEEAKCHHHWTALFEDFYTFCQMWDKCFFFFFFFPRSFLNRWSLRFSDCFTGQSPGIGRNEWAISIPVAPALQGSWPSPSQCSLRRGWEAAGLRGWVWGLGQINGMQNQCT